MCWRSSSAYDLYRRTNSRAGRSLFGWLRKLWGPRPSKVKDAEVVSLHRPEAAARVDREADRKDCIAAWRSGLHPFGRLSGSRLSWPTRLTLSEVTRAEPASMSVYHRVPVIGGDRSRLPPVATGLNRSRGRLVRPGARASE
jgi:hypothetical protein